ncbi:MAG: AAA family ATPase [Dehalococcoidia bacterium]|jgi:hypothetical protein
MQSWVVDGLIPKEHNVLVLGKPHNGKSWIVDELAVAVASGTKFINCYDTVQSDVILLDDDSPSSVVHERVARLAAGRNLKLPELGITVFSHGAVMEPISGRFIDTELGCDFGMWQPSHREWLTEEILKLKNPLVILDSMIKIMAGSNLDKTGHAMKAVNYWREIKAKTGATMVMTHHMSLKRGNDKEASDFDPSALAMGNTMIVGSSDTVLFVYRVPVASSTEFIIKPLPRREKLKVGTFSCELVEDKELTWARFDMLGEPTHLPSEDARQLFPLFYTDDDEREGLTVAAVLKESGKALGEKEIREALKELEGESVLVRRTERHNRFRYKINPMFDSGWCLPTPYMEVLKGEVPE